MELTLFSRTVGTIIIGKPQELLRSIKDWHVRQNLIGEIQLVSQAMLCMHKRSKSFLELLAHALPFALEGRHAISPKTHQF